MDRILLSQSNTQEVIQHAIEVLENGGIIIYPTETCYGLGVDATNQYATDRLLEFKTRREGKPISVAVTGKEMAKHYVDINDIAENLYDNFLPGPITVVSHGRGTVAVGLESEFHTLGIRVPEYPLVLELIKQFGKPITSTSANVSYKPRAYSYEAFVKETPKSKLGMVDLFIDAGKLPYNEPSTVVDTTLNSMNVLRQGEKKFDEATEGMKPLLTANSKKVDDTISFGGVSMLKFLDFLREGCVIFELAGELGAGKTHFTKGIAKQLKIEKVIKSPTFNIISEYKYELGDKSGLLVHVDTWRIYDAPELERLKINEYVKPGNVIAIEWADKFHEEFINSLGKPDVPTKVLMVKFEYLAETERELKIYEV